MRKHAVLVTLVLVQALAEVLLAFYWFVMRADLGYAAGVAPAGLAAQIATSPWFAWSVAAGALPVLASLLPGWRPRARHWLAGTGVVWTVFGLTYAVAAAYLPAFAPTMGSRAGQRLPNLTATPKKARSAYTAFTAIYG